MKNDINTPSEHTKLTAQPSPITPSLVPMVFPIGIALLILLLTGLSFLFMPNLTWVFALKVLFVYLAGIPSVFLVGSMILNKVSADLAIQKRNALTLGLLFSCVFILWKMGAYS